MSQGPESFSPPPQPPGGSGDAASKVANPAMGLMITAGIGIALAVLSLLMNMLGTGIGAVAAEDQQMAALQAIFGGLGMVLNVVGILVCVFVFWGAQRMRQLENYGVALAASILAMIPCISPCCVIGLPIGIWSLVVLMTADVTAAFR